MGRFGAGRDQLGPHRATEDDREYSSYLPNSELPPGHWARFVRWVSVKEHRSLADDVKMFLVQGNAIFDADIAAWAYSPGHGEAGRIGFSRGGQGHSRHVAPVSLFYIGKNGKFVKLSRAFAAFQDRIAESSCRNGQ